MIFEGATKLPDNSENAIWVGVQHWCSLLTAIRRILHNADWDVRVDDREIQWDDEVEEYNPQR